MGKLYTTLAKTLVKQAARWENQAELHANNAAQKDTPEELQPHLNLAKEAANRADHAYQLLRKFYMQALDYIQENNLGHLEVFYELLTDLESACDDAEKHAREALNQLQSIVRMLDELS